MVRSVCPGVVTRDQQDPNGLRVWIDGDPASDESRRVAAARFQSLLGVLRAWWVDAGQRFDERLTGLGQGSIRNRNGDQWVTIGPVICHSHEHGDLQITTASGCYRVPPAAPPLVAAHTHTFATEDTSDGVLFAMTSAALSRLIADAATRTGLPAPRGRHRDVQVTDLTTPVTT